ncbi:peptidoglycan/LPS O-acetylase OafA/YrhL [Bradyrhizobium japonicum]
MGLLRLLLALAVVGDHVLPPFPWLRLTTGVMAVEVFFVVSGFYMQMVLSQRYASAGAFYLSRAFRIFPTYWLVAALAFALWPVNDFREIASLGWQPAILVPVGRSKSPGYGHLKLPHLMIAVSAAEQQ